jgi:hypothetical protein
MGTSSPSIGLRYVVPLAAGAVLFLSGLFWSRPWWMVVPESPIGFNASIGIALFAVSAFAAGWVFLRFRGVIGNNPAGNHEDSQPVVSTSDEPSVQSNGVEIEAGDRCEASQWLVRIGCVASAVILTALLIGDPVLVINVLALAMTAIAFVLILILVPRGL